MLLKYLTVLRQNQMATCSHPALEFGIAKTQYKIIE